MSNILITKEKIKKMFSAPTYNRGHLYYKQGRVNDLEFNSVQNIWFAKVEGSELYDVTVEVDNRSVHSFCDCPAYDRFFECKHAVAVLLEISDRHGRLIPHQSGINRQKKKYETANRFINLFIDSQLTGSRHKDAKHVLKVEFICKSVTESSLYSEGMMLTIEMKTGLDRVYVVRNLKEFLTNIHNHQSHEFTKHFTYDPMEHHFSNEDQTIIHILQQIVEHENMYRDSHSYYWSGALTNDRELIIPPMIAKELLTKLQHCSFTFVHKDIDYTGIDFLEREAPLSFQLHKREADEFALDLTQLRNVSFFNRYGWIFLEGTFYECPNRQKRLLEGIRKNLNAEQMIPVAKEQLSDFLSHVLPGLKQLGHVAIADDVSNDIIQPPLTSKLFIDEEDGRLFVQLEYHYDDHVIYPFARNEAVRENDGPILIRDAEKEREMMELIERAPLNVYKNQLYLHENEEAMYDFLFTIIPSMNSIADVYITDRVQSYMQPDRFKPFTSIDVDSSSQLLEINFNMDGIDDHTIQTILQSVIEKKKYYRLPNGSFLSLENEEFQYVDKLFTELKIKMSDVKDNRLQLPLYRGIQIDEIMSSTSKGAAKVSKAFRQLIQHIKHPEELDFTLPDTLQASLRSYQQTGFQWLKALSHYSLGGILADDMGLGKTLQSIAYMLSVKKETSSTKPFLVVAPASLIYNWKGEFNKFAPELKTKVAAGTPKEREALFCDHAMPDVWITSYQTLRQDIEIYGQLDFHTLILDEAQAIKNHATKTAGAVRAIRAEKRFALSGTPIENSLDELWSVFQTILPGFFPNQQVFRKLPPEQIARMARPFILRRVKKDVLKELPDKIETNHLSELTKKQKELYAAYLENVRTSLETEDFNKNRIKILAGLTRLRQICCHPSLFIENYKGESSKLEQLLDITRQAIGNGKRLLIFSQFSSMLHIIREQLQKEEIGYFYLDGQTPSKERVEMADRFNVGEHDVFLISLKAGGTGLNLTGADTVILYDLWWNPAIEEQAAGRAHRIGQKKVVQVIRLIAQGTIEEKIYELQQKKKELIQQVIQTGETLLTSLSEAELREILSMQ